MKLSSDYLSKGNSSLILLKMMTQPLPLGPQEGTAEAFERQPLTSRLELR